jgi:hypothetical protein
MHVSRQAIWMVSCLATTIAILCVCIAYRIWPRKLPAGAHQKMPIVFVRDGALGIALPTDALIANVGEYERAGEAYLNFDFLRSQRVVDSRNLLVCKGAGMPGRDHGIFLHLDNDILTSLPYLHILVAEGLIRKFALYSWSNQDLDTCYRQSAHFEAAFRSPPLFRLHQISDKLLIAPIADFLVFKSATDLRVLARRDPIPLPLSLSHAKELAEDIIVVARFYSLPLDYFLGIGAMENNYMSVRGDLDHAVWKRRPQRGDVVLRRRRGRVLVRNYSLGVWQITRETLRYAQLLYLRDRQTRDYNGLPEGLRPVVLQNPDDIPPETLTTYAGLLFRDLLNRFDGDVMRAVGAYNGGAQYPNPAYADSVRVVARYARRVIVHGVALDSAAKEVSARRQATTTAPDRNFAGSSCAAIANCIRHFGPV